MPKTKQNDIENKEDQGTENTNINNKDGINDLQQNNTEQSDLHDTESDNKSEKIKVFVKCNTGNNSYYRAGIKFFIVFREYQITKEVLEILKKDKHLIITDTLD